MFGDTKESSKTEDIYYDLRFENPCIGESYDFLFFIFIEKFDFFNVKY